MLVNISRGEWGNRETGFHRVEGGCISLRERLCARRKRESTGGGKEGKATVRNVKEAAPNKDEWAVVHT